MTHTQTASFDFMLSVTCSRCWETASLYTTSPELAAGWTVEAGRTLCAECGREGSK